MKSLNKDNSTENKNNAINYELSKEPNEWVVLRSMVYIGIAMVIIFSCHLLWGGKSNSDLSTNDIIMNFLSSAATGILLGGAGFAGGGLMGFLFAIPSVEQNKNLIGDNKNPDQTRLIQNDNLVQISDWFTKILVGVGLTQLYNISPAIIKMGEKLKPSFGGADIGRNMAIAVVLYFTITGFLSVYIWTRTQFLKKLDDLNAILANRNKELQAKVLQSDEKIEKVTQDNKEKTKEMKAIVNTFSASADSLKAKREYIKESPDLPNDTQKGKWGEKTEANGRKITANVSETSFDKEWFNINLEVISTDKNKPLTGEVRFHLHSSFPNQVETVEAANNSAKLNLVGWGAFTVGAECDNGNTKLEIDLADLPDAPKLFKER